MKGKKELFTVLVSALLITGLFYKQSLGLNLVLFEILFFISLIYKRQLPFSSRNQILFTLGFLSTSIFTIITHSVFAYFIHFLALVIFIGLINYPKVNSLINSLGVAFSSLFNTQAVFINTLFHSKVNGKKLGSFFWKFRIFIIPLIIIILFLIIYSASNPIFNNLTSKGVDFIINGFVFLFEDLEIGLIFTFFFGIIISNFLFIRSVNKRIVEIDFTSKETLVRQRRNSLYNFGILGLKNEFKAALFLIVTLNIMLLILNGVDVYWVWFNFDWDGQTLKQFVHNGTYLLILSIIISIILVLYFFRRNLNFYPKNNLLKLFSYLWLFQNAILVISVGIRNYWYINHYSLAYKRIGVVIFLIITLYGLYTVIQKIKNKKSPFYLYRSNALFIYIVLVICSFINWDSFIAKYNFNHAEQSYVHLNYLKTLSDKALPYLDKSENELFKIEKIQNKKFGQSTNNLTPSKYYTIIQSRKKQFKKTWKEKHVLEWNFAEYKAYKKLSKRNPN